MKKVILGLMVLASVYEASAGCKINIFVKNTGDYNINVQNYSSSTGVKSKGGFWKALDTGSWFHRDSTIWTHPGERKGDDFSAAFGCGVNRRYRIKYDCLNGPKGGSSFTEYFPSSTGWTTRQSFTVKLPRCK